MMLLFSNTEQQHLKSSIEQIKLPNSEEFPDNISAKEFAGLDNSVVAIEPDKNPTT